MNELYDDPSTARAEVNNSIANCKGEWDSAVVPVGGVESLLAYLMACDVFGPDNTLAVTAHSVFSNSEMLAKIDALMDALPGHHCTIDITRPIQETLQLHIGLRRIETEQLHYSMDHWQKAETVVLLRSAICRGIAVRSESLHIESYSKSKIDTGWVVPTIFDWNPVHMLSRKQVLISLLGILPSGFDVDEQSGLDVWADGGPFPEDAKLDLNNPTKKLDLIRLSGDGLGTQQRNMI